MHLYKSEVSSISPRSLLLIFSEGWVKDAAIISEVEKCSISVSTQSFTLDQRVERNLAAMNACIYQYTDLMTSQHLTNSFGNGKNLINWLGKEWMFFGALFISLINNILTNIEILYLLNACCCLKYPNVDSKMVEVLLITNGCCTNWNNILFAGQ